MFSYVPLDQFILFGDSITQGSYDQSKGFALAAELQNAYVRRLDIINRGYSGYNSDAALEVISKIIPPPEQAAVKFLTIWFGANDANTSPTQTQHVPLPRFISNLRSILTHPSITAHAAHVILLTTPPFEESVLEEFREAWGYTGRVRQAVDAAAYAAATRNLGSDMGVPVLDVWGLFMERAGWKEGDVVLPGSKAAGKSEALAELLVDGLHLSPKGYKVVFDGLIALIKERWPDFPPYKMPFAVKVGWERELGD